MIPKRIHRDLPDDAAWIIGEKRRQLTVYLANDIPADGPLEQHFVRQATRAWRRRHYPGPLVILPIAASGIAWALRKMRQPLIAAGVAGGAAVTAFAAVTVTSSDQHPHPPAVMGAPPTHSPAAPPRAGSPSPSQPPTTPPPPASPPPPAVAPAPEPDKPHRPGPHPTTGRGNSSGKPGRTPPGHGGTPPGHGGPPPGKPPSKPPPSTPPGGGSTIESTCQLVEIHVGKLVRICL